MRGQKRDWTCKRWRLEQISEREVDFISTTWSSLHGRHGHPLLMRKITRGGERAAPLCPLRLCTYSHTRPLSPLRRCSEVREECENRRGEQERCGADGFRGCEEFVLLKFGDSSLRPRSLPSSFTPLSLQVGRALHLQRPKLEVSADSEAGGSPKHGGYS